MPTSSVLAEAELPASEEEKAAIGLAFQKLQQGTPQDLEEAVNLFSNAIAEWRSNKRPQAELAQLLIARAKALCEQNEAVGGTKPTLLESAIQDFSEALTLIRSDPDVPALDKDGHAAFQEFPDAVVRRGLAYEGLQRWEAAIADYNEAIKLWGGEDSTFRPGAFSDGGRLGVNPYVMNFRGNALCRLGRYEEAIEDYRVASQQFAAVQDLPAYVTSLANEALALYGAKHFEEAEAKIRIVLRKDPKQSDMHVALAVILWNKGEATQAENAWQYACDRTQEGCRRYKDSDWVREIRRWPPNLSEGLTQFLKAHRGLLGNTVATS